MHLGFVTDIYPSDLFPSVLNLQSIIFSYVFLPKKKKHCIYIIQMHACLGDLKVWFCQPHISMHSKLILFPGHILVTQG